MESLTRQRPLGITIIASIIGIIGILTFIGVILGFFGVNALIHNRVLDVVATIALLIAAIIALAEIVVAWGLWTLKAWAFWTAVIVELIRVVHGVFGLIVTHGQGTHIVSLIVALVILVYLCVDPNVRAAFRV
jgi:uncharacterized membrane protein (DUF2068 family)